MEEFTKERWDSLAEVHFSFNGDITDDNYIYCLCSRNLIKEDAQIYPTHHQGGSESEAEKVDADSHVHFSQDTRYREKFEKDDVGSCYCSASHTDNNYSTDEHDTNAPRTRPVQTSDSGADLTYPDAHSDENNAQTSTHTPPCEAHTIKDIPMDDSPLGIAKGHTDFPENYLNYGSWDMYWQDNGERLIWASWIKQYSDYINPAYMQQESNSLSKENSADVNSITELEAEDSKGNDMRERKFSYDSTMNPRKVESLQASTKDNEWTPLVRKRSSSEHERLLSPRTFEATDSMTNVTKMTMSSCDIGSSRVTSESSKSDDYSVSSSSSADQSNEHTRLFVDDDTTIAQTEDPEQYWQFLWQKHFGEQYALHYANYTETHSNLETPVQIEEDIVQDSEYQNEEKLEQESDGNSQEPPSVVEVQEKVEKMKINDKKPRKNKPTSGYINSVGVLLQTLLNEEKKKCEEIDGGDGNEGKSKNFDQIEVTASTGQESQANNCSSNVGSKLSPSQDGEEPPEENKTVKLKRRHEIDADEAASEKVASTFTQIGLTWNGNPGSKCELVYSKKSYLLKPPCFRRSRPKKTYFDDDGMPYSAENVQSGNKDDTKESLTDEDCLNTSKEEDSSNRDTQQQLPGVGSVAVEQDKTETDTAVSDYEECEGEVVKRKRRRHRRNPPLSPLPPEIATDYLLQKYWRKRHSLFHRFDEGIRLDTESWFSVTPEKVAKHLAERCRCDLIVDAFCGAGGNTIQFARTCERVIAVDIDPRKIELARHNAGVYGLGDRIEFVVGDFFELAPALKADVVFLSPPWGGPQYTKEKQYDLETMLEPKPASQLMEAAFAITNNVALFVPRRSRTEQLVEFAKTCGSVEIEQNFLGRSLIALTAYYGELVN